MRREFTATVYLIDNERTLLLYHKKHRKWLPPGGHLEPNEVPHLAAIREAREETGLEIELIEEENVWVEKISIPRPYLCLLEPLEDHEHIDLIYVGRPIGGTLNPCVQETEGAHWYTREEVGRLERGRDIFEDTYQIISHLLPRKPVPSDLASAQG